MGRNRLFSYALLLVLLVFFAVLALDIAFPATVLSMMALIRWSVLPADETAFNGGAA